MIKKILKDVLGENFTENNEKYAKINFIIVKSKFVCKFIFQLCGFIYATFIFKRFD